MYEVKLIPPSFEYDSRLDTHSDYDILDSHRSCAYAIDSMEEQHVKMYFYKIVYRQFGVVYEYWQWFNAEYQLYLDYESMSYYD